MKKAWLLFFLAPYAFGMNSLQGEIGFGFPGLFAGRLMRTVSDRVAVGAGVGVLPLSWIISTVVTMPTTSVSDRYSLVYDPKADAIAPSLFVHWQPGESDLHVRFDLTVQIGAAGGNAFLRNLATGASTNVAKVEGTLFLPRLSVMVGKTLWRTESFAVVGQIGLSYLIGASLNVSVTGAMPSYLDVVPEARPTIQDGLRAAEDELTRALNDGIFRNRILPAVSIHASF